MAKTNSNLKTQSPQKPVTKPDPIKHVIRGASNDRGSRPKI